MKATKLGTEFNTENSVRRKADKTESYIQILIGGGNKTQGTKT